MTLTQIAHVLSIAGCGSMTAAAQANHISQSALSQALKNLEAELNTPLFRKEGKQLVLTEDGKYFCEKGFFLISMAEKLLEEMRSRADNIQRLTFYTDVVDNSDETVLIFEHYFPDIQLERQYMSHDQALAALKNGTLDFMLTLRAEQDPALHTEKLIDEPVVMLVRNDYRLAERECIDISELDGEILTIYQNSGSLEALFREFFSLAGVAPSRVMQVHEPIIQIQRNAGMIFMPESTYHSLAKTGKTGSCIGIPVRDTFCRRRVFLSFLSGQSLRPCCIGFYNFLRTYHKKSAEDRCLPPQEDFYIIGKYHLELK